jgi:hypothetical protein
MAVIDADTHVIETEHTWDYLDPSEQQFRPIVVIPRGETGREYWYIDGKIRGLAAGRDRSRRAQSRREARPQDGRAQEAREGENVEVRLQHMDGSGWIFRYSGPPSFWSA